MNLQITTEGERRRKLMEGADQKPHAVCVPAPFQSHIKAMLKFSKLLQSKGFYIAFVNTEFNHQRFLRSRGSNSFDGFPDFQFVTIPDSLPPTDSNATQDTPSLRDSIMKNFLLLFLTCAENSSTLQTIL